MTTFADLGLREEVVKAVTELGYDQPTDIQAAAIPALLEGKDVIAQAKTGTGKTAAFALPMLTRFDPEVKAVQGLVIVPTRELATQVSRAFSRYGKHLDVHALAVYGGQSYAYQGKRLASGVPFVVCTPGRANDLIEKGTLKLDRITSVALDEADEMLRMGFIEEVDKILAATPPTRQTALFSATMPDPIRRLAERYMRDAVPINVRDEALTVENVIQRFYLLDEASKLPALARLLETEDIERALIFARTRVGCALLADTLIARGFSAEAIHGDLPQEARESVLNRFRAGRIKLLVATDVAARGLDIPAVSHVINYDFPDQPEDYVHRIGRTARAGASGSALSLVTPRDRPRLAEVGFYTRRAPVRAIVPTVAEVHARRDERFSHGVDEAAVEGDLQAALRWVDAQSEAGKDLRTLAAAAVLLARQNEISRPDEEVHEIFPKAARKEPPTRGPAPRRRDDRPVRGAVNKKTGREQGMVRFSIALGRSSGVRAADVVASVARNANVPGSALGAIKIGQSRTTVDVAEKYAMQVAKKLRKGFVLRGQTVTMNPE